MVYSTSVAVLRIIDSQTYSGRVEIAASSPQQLEVSHDVCSRNIKGRSPSDKQSQSCTGRDPFVFVMHLYYHYSPDA